MLIEARLFVQRTAPLFTLDPTELRTRASPGCPPALISLALACASHHPHDRPSMPHVLAKLREIELDVMARQVEGRAAIASEHVGSIKVLPSVKIGRGRALESLFREGLATRTNANAVDVDADEEEEVLAALADGSIEAMSMNEEGTVYRTARWEDPEAPITPGGKAAASRPSAMSIFKDSRLASTGESLLFHSDDVGFS